MNTRITLAALALVLPLAAQGGEGMDDTAKSLAQKSMIVDTHIDTPYRLREDWEDVSGHTERGNFDYERARQGGLDVPFMAIYTPAESEAEGTSFKLANQLIDSVEALVGRAPDKFTVVRSPADAKAARKAGKIGLAMGMENGSPIEGKLENVAFFRERGVSYITMAHSLSNHLSDSSYDKERKWNGLSPFGKEVVVEMNRVGMMVDVSHLSDDAFWQVLEISKAPVIASHSSARHFTPGWERNMSDEMIKALAARDGVVMINFGSSFVTDEARLWFDNMAETRQTWLEENGYDEHGPERGEFNKRYREENPFPYADMDDVIRHFTHVIDLVGIEHVGIGSDFDGVGNSLPEGMKDVSFYPKLLEGLLELEYPVADIEKVMNGNVMRVWQACLVYAEQAAAGP